MPRRDAIFDILDEWEETGNYEDAYQMIQREYRIYMPTKSRRSRNTRRKPARKRKPQKPKRRNLSKWQKYMKQKKNQIKYKSGEKKGRLNLKMMGRAYRKKNK